MAEQQIISAVASSSNSSSTVSPKKYDVFLSFRGEDTRIFTSHLYEALKQKKVETYIDYLLERGDEISPALIKVIKDSHISVVILSENYASSKWCLEELRNIIECRKSQGQCVKPIFYNIDPADVRKQTGSYKTAFENHVGDPRCNKWKAALTEVANLVGWDFQNRTESELWDGVQNLVNLKVIDLSNSPELIEIPDLSKAEKLETVNLNGCKNLSGTTVESLAANIKFLPLLKTLHLDGCSKLVSLPELPPSLWDLWLHGCSKLVSLPELPPSLWYLWLQGCSKLVSLAELPPSLRHLWLQGCSKLVSLPKLPPSLRHLWLKGCSKLVSLPELPPSLSHLWLKGCSKLVSLPELPPSLRHLWLEGCSKLVSLPELPPSLHDFWLEGVQLQDCTTTG